MFVSVQSREKFPDFGNCATASRACDRGRLRAKPLRAITVRSQCCVGQVQRNCIASGIPASRPNYVQGGGPNAQIGVTTGGNKALKPETSNSYTAGVVLSPAFLRDKGFSKRLDLEVSYYDISLNGAIRAIDATTLLDRCAQTGDPLSCSTIRRSAATGNVLGINALLQNIGAITTNGIDATLTYRTPQTSLGSFGLFFSNTYLLKYREIVPATTGYTRIPRDAGAIRLRPPELPDALAGLAGHSLDRHEDHQSGPFRSGPCRGAHPLIDAPLPPAYLARLRGGVDRGVRAPGFQGGLCSV